MSPNLLASEHDALMPGVLGTNSSHVSPISDAWLSNARSDSVGSVVEPAPLRGP